MGICKHHPDWKPFSYLKPPFISSIDTNTIGVQILRWILIIIILEMQLDELASSPLRVRIQRRVEYAVGVHSLMIIAHNPLIPVVRRRNPNPRKYGMTLRYFTGKISATRTVYLRMQTANSLPRYGRIPPIAQLHKQVVLWKTYCRVEVTVIVI